MLIGPARAPDGVGAGSFAPEAPLETTVDGLQADLHAADPRFDIDLIGRAYAVADAAHRDQVRDNGDPYISHPIAVARILAGYRLDPASIATALLHDVVEDTGVSREQLTEKFGAEIASLVDGVTKLTKLEINSDRTKQAENFKKLVLAMSRDIRVLLVKLADRLHNMRTLHFVPQIERRQRIARETMDIYAPLAERMGMDAIKSELQTLAFQQLEPEGFGSITARLTFLRGQGADVIEEVKVELRRICAEAGIDVVDVGGREKSPFSIWEKMQRRQVQFEQLSDIMAFRLVVPTREECYGALGAVHAAYSVIAGRFKDYISTPRANGYRSLHTGVTLREPRNQKIEIQIRTLEMQDVAENGLAAHWSYKQQTTTAERFPWVRDLLEILENSSTDEFLTNTRLELYADQVFCFTPKGQLIQLPRGATPIDFAYAVHSQVGDTCVGARVNGQIQGLRVELQNGDQVEIMTARGGTPSPQWERFVVTGKARARIRRFVQQQQRTAHIDQGRAALAKAFRQDGVDGSEKILEPALKAFKAATAADLYLMVGTGNVGPKEVVAAAYPELRPAAREPHMPPALPRATPRPPGGLHDLPISGLVAGMAYSFAGCCRPLPGDRISGIVTTGKGVTIHTRDCPTLDGFAATPERFIDVDWEPWAFRPAGGGKSRDGKPAETFIGRISIVAHNDTRVPATIAQAVSKHDGAVANLRVTDRSGDFCDVLLDVEVRDLPHLITVIAGLRAAGGIHQVERAKG